MRRGAIVLAWIIAVTATAAAQDDAFKKGIDARDDEKWAEVVTHMREAITADPMESTRSVGRIVFVGGTAYLPHFYLGEAYLKQNDCARALAAWDQSERQGVIAKRTRELDVLRKGSAECEAKGFLLAARMAAEGVRAAAAI